MNPSMRGLALGLVLTLTVAAAGNAQITVFTSRATFTSAAGPLTTETFGMPLQAVPDIGATYSVSAGTITFDANHGFETFGGGDLYADVHPPGGGPPQFFRIDFAQPVTAFGADYSEFDYGAPPILLRAWIGTSAFQFGEGFFGVVSTVPFTRVEIREPTDYTFFVMDNLSSTATTPEPAAVWLVGSVLIIGTVGCAGSRGQCTTS